MIFLVISCSLGRFTGRRQDGGKRERYMRDSRQSQRQRQRKTIRDKRMEKLREGPKFRLG